MRWCWKIFLMLGGWQTSIAFPHHHLKKYIVIIAPHTSSLDFIIGLAYRSILRMKNVRYLGKAELFRPPYGFIFRWLGGTPVDRKHHQNLVDQVVELFNRHQHFAIAISPEGTRKRIDKLKTGFYYIALKAKVPIIMVGLDFKNKRVVVSDAFYTTGNQEADFETIFTFFRPIEGRHPELGLGHL